MIQIARKYYLLILISIVFLSTTLVIYAHREISAAPTVGVTELVSVSSSGELGNDMSGFGGIISADGRYVVYESEATNLVNGDANGGGFGGRDVFIRDRQSGVTELISVSSSGEQGNGFSVWPFVSADGRFVVFYSDSSNLVSGDTNGVTDVFVRDRLNDVTELVSKSSTGEQGNADSHSPYVSSDGRFIVFSSRSTNLISGDLNGKEDVFVHDRQSGVTELVSISSNGEMGNRDSSASAISDDGRYVAFYSGASNFVSGDTNGIYDSFIHDRQSGITELVSVSSSGEPGNGDSYEPHISGNGRYVSFSSHANNLVTGDTNGVSDIFFRDRQSGITERVSVSSSGDQGNSDSFNQYSSDDGRFVTFGSGASNLVSGDANGQFDIFIRDRQSGTTEIVSVSTSGEYGNGHSNRPSISADGSIVGFYSDSSNLVSGDTNCVFDVFVRDRFGTQPPPPTTEPPPQTCEPPPIDEEPWLIMYYLAGDNFLNDKQKWLLEVIKKYENQPAYNIAVMVDGLANNDSRFYYIADNTIFQVKDELDSGNPATLVEFINWSLGMFPVEHTALVINDHAGLTGIARDDSSGYSLIEVNELGNALQEVHNQWGKIDILFLEACLMGTLEVGYQVKDYVNYLIASEHLLGFTSPDYLNSIEALTSPEELAIGIANNYDKEMGVIPHTISVAQMSALPNLATKNSTFADLLKSKMNEVGYEIIRLQILISVQRFSSNPPICKIDLDDESIDLYDFARLVKEKTIDTDLKNAAQGVMDAIEDDPNQSNRYIIKNLPISGIVPNDWDCPGENWELDNSHGVSTFFPKPDSKRSWYNGNTFAFAIGTNWGLNSNLVSDYLEDTIQWGPMLVEYVNVVYPDAVDDPNPPPIVPPLIEKSFNNVFLPVTFNK